MVGKKDEQAGFKLPWPAVSAIFAFIACLLAVSAALKASARAEGVAETKLQSADGLRDRLIRVETRLDGIDKTLTEHGGDLKEILRRIPPK